MTTMFVLIALLKTPGEGGTVQIPYPDQASCEAAGAQLEQQFEGIAHDGVLTALYTCLEVTAPT